ncbi:MAG: hypothetical protein Q9187_009160 [Circinaria calcarea]
MFTPTTDETEVLLLTAKHVAPEAPEYPAMPLAPRPSADLGTNLLKSQPDEDLGVFSEEADMDIFTLTPVAALKMLCSSVENLIRTTGDVPPTPPVSLPHTPIFPFVEKEKENIGQWGETTRGSISSEKKKRFEGKLDVDEVPARKTPIGSPEAGPTEPFHMVASHSESLYVQHGAIARKFYSKRPPPISLEEYLLRLHLYCPMSTAVYLATGFYIHRLAVIERILPVTVRNAHRLLLAGLRIAMKALEDLSYPHRRFAKVGGVSEPELGRLEISFCFLTNFELKVDKEMLYRQATLMRDGARFEGVPLSFTPMLPIVGRKHKAPIPSQE